jgi:hypothetical protein
MRRLILLGKDLTALLSAPDVGHSGCIGYIGFIEKSLVATTATARAANVADIASAYPAVDASWCQVVLFASIPDANGGAVEVRYLLP